MKVNNLLQLLDHVDLDAVAMMMCPETQCLVPITGIVHNSDTLEFQCDIDGEEHG